MEPDEERAARSEAISAGMRRAAERRGKKLRMEQVREHLDKGLTVRQVAEVLGTSTQSTYQSLQALRRKGYVWPKERS